MARFFALGLIALPIIEIAIFIKVGQAIGLLPTLALVIGATILGGLLLRQQGLNLAALVVESHGERNLLVPTPDNVDEPRNRRVEITLR